MIPKQFEIFGATIKVEFNNDICEKEKAFGLYYDHINKIYLQDKYEGEERNPEEMEVTYYHELTHCILKKLGYDKLSKDEALIERLSKALHQVLKTSK